jgi:hypothetical protein
MKKAILLILAAALISSEARPNGSSGIGNPRIPVTDGVYIQDKKGAYLRSSEGITRASDGALVLEIKSLSRAEALSRAGAFRPSILGEVKALEFIPDRSATGRNAQNSWLICGSPETCVHVSATGNGDFEAASLIGGLVK